MKTRYIIALAAGALALVGCQREELAEPGVLSGKEGVVKFAPSVGGIVTGVKSSASEDASAATYTQPLTLTSEDGGFTLPMGLSVTSLETGNGTKATLINENGGISNADFATAIGNIFWVAAWDATPSRIIPDDPAGEALENYVEGSDENGWYQKVAYRNGASGKYWMTIQKQTATVSGAPADADDEYIWKKTEEKTFYAYANVPSGATMAQLSNADGQTMTLSALPDKDVLMGYYAGNGSTGSPATQTGTASIQFHHPFAAVKVKKGTVADGVTITGVAIEKVYGKGGEGDDGKLMVKQEEDTFTWTRADGDPFEDENLVESISVTCDGEAALVLPQTFPSKARICVSLEQGGKDFNVYYILSGSWAPGTLYTYTIGYDPLPDELLTGKFSVSATDYVQFSRGNLYCTRSGEEGSYTYEFGLERNQYDFRTRPGYASVINGVYAVNGTGANMSGHFYWDIAKAQAGKDYGAFSTTSTSGGTTSDILDWGPALDAASHWTTLSSTEWEYLISTRKVKSATGLGSTCQFVYFKGVDGLDTGVDGLIIYPDDYDGDLFTNQQEITAIPDGCVFIPMAGNFVSGAVKNVNIRCNYWTLSHGTEGGNAYQFLAYGTVCHAKNILSRDNGLSVRLVQRFEKPLPEIEFIDLGLPSGTLWANMNLGAYGEDDYGNYYAWGEVLPYHADRYSKETPLTHFRSMTTGAGNTDITGYNSHTYSQNGSTSFTEWTTKPYNESTLELLPQYDAASYAITGAQTPSYIDWVELNTNCTWTWTGNHNETNIAGYIVTSNVEGYKDRSIFLPATGIYSNVTFTNLGTRASYLSRTRRSDNAENAYVIYIYSTFHQPDYSGSRCNGFPVRAVKKRPVEYVEIAGLKWATENLAITESGKKEWKGTGHIVGDYFQWGAYAGYCGDVTDADKGLVLYQSFTCKGCGDSADKFTMKTGKRFNAAFAPFNKGASPYPYLEYTAAPATLASEHDVANIVLGGKWRMPTTGEIVAMRNATYWVWDDTDKGYYVCLPSGTCEAGGQGNVFPSGTDKTDALLFIPASGYVKYGTETGNKLFQSTIVSDIWSSSLNEQTNNAYNLYFGGTGAEPVGILPGYNNSRYMGFSIRPVADK